VRWSGAARARSAHDELVVLESGRCRDVASRHKPGDDRRGRARDHLRRGPGPARVGQARSRTENAVRRTVPFGLYCYSITVVWYALHGHHPNDAADRREQAPWYTTKTDPSFADMLAKLRRVIIAARFLPATAGRPTDAEIRAVQQAWARAGIDQAA
jgi:hypothetical protein